MEPHVSKIKNLLT